MSKNSNYHSTNRSKHYLKCHLIFVCKYRKKLLVGQLKNDMKYLLLNITSNSDFEVEVFESDMNHIHFLIRYLPKLPITAVRSRKNVLIPRKIATPVTSRESI